MDLPTAITFDVPYPMSIFISDIAAANTGEDEQVAMDSSVINGFQVFGPGCDAELTISGTQYDPAQCGAPIPTAVTTQSGFLYGGQAPVTDSLPEPASLWLLALGCALAYAVRKRASSGSASP
jgi:hypothetical protein